MLKGTKSKRTVTVGQKPTYLYDVKREFIEQARKLDVWIKKRGKIHTKPWWHS